jgi:hypothetical protein
MACIDGQHMGTEIARLGMAAEPHRHLPEGQRRRWDPSILESFYPRTWGKDLKTHQPTKHPEYDRNDVVGNLKRQAERGIRADAF